MSGSPFEFITSTLETLWLTNFKNSQTALSDLYDYAQMGVNLSKKVKLMKFTKISMTAGLIVVTTITYSTEVYKGVILGFHELKHYM